jgi:hypothetical protein
VQETPAARPPTPQVDPALKALLEKSLPEVNVAGTAFSDVIDFLRDITVANIFVNWNALEAAGIDRNAPVTLRLRNVAFGKVLDVLLDAVSGDTKLAYTADQGVISISVAQAAVSAARQTHVTMIDGKPVVTTQAIYHAVRMVVGPQKMTLDGEETTWEKAKETLSKLANRGELVLEVAVASDQMTLAQHNEALSKGLQLANALKFKYLSDVGVHPLGSKAGEASKPTTRQSSVDEPPDVSADGAYYLGGHVARPGVYSLTGRQIRLRQALSAAGGMDPGTWHVRIARKKADHTEEVIESVLGAEDMEKKNLPADVYLHQGDQIMVSAIKEPNKGEKITPAPTTKSILSK